MFIINVDSTPPQTPVIVVAPKIASTSFEYGVEDTFPNAVLETLLKNTKGDVRIGGGSQNGACPDTDFDNTNYSNGQHKCFYTVSDARISKLKSAMDRINAKLTMGLNFLRPQASVLKMADKLVAQGVTNLEPNNEFDLWVNQGYKTAPYGFAQFKPEWDLKVNPIVAKYPNVTILGPSPCCSYVKSNGPTGVTGNELAAFAGNTPVVDFVNPHPYARAWCDKSLPQPTPESLLDEARIKQFNSDFLDVSKNLGTGQVFGLGETNDIACSGGDASETTASTLWLTDWLLNATLNNGAQFAYVHNPINAKYSAFGKTSTGVIFAKQKYYGMLLVAQLTDWVKLNYAYYNPDNYNLKTYALKTPTPFKKDVRVVFINKGLVPAVTYVKLPGHAQNWARIYEMSTGLGNITATTGMKLGLNDIGADGSFVFTKNRSIPPVAGTDGEYNLTIPVGAAIVLDVA